jgi:hypothetical protein
MSEHVFEVGSWVDFVEFARTDETVHRRRALTAAVGANEQIVFPAQREFAFILPISGKKLKSIIVGMRYMVAASRFETSSNAAAAWCMSKLTLA